MTFAIVKNSQLVRILHDNDTNVVISPTITCDPKILPVYIRKQNGIYDFFWDAPVPKYNKAGASSYTIDDNLGTVRETITLIPFTPEELAAAVAIENQQAADAAAIVTARGDNVITYLINHTPAEIVSYIQTNVTDLASAKNVLGKLAIAVSILAKKELR